MKPKDAFEAVRAIVGTVPEDERNELFDLISGNYSIGAIAVGGSESTAETTVPNLESLLSDEQLAKMTLYREKISESWGINKEDLRLVAEVTSEGTKRIVLADSSPIGQYKGSYKSIYEKGDNLLEVDGRKVDVLGGMTDDIYRAMIADAKKRGGLLPDSQKASRAFGDLWTWTMLTGEPLTAGGRVRIRLVVEGGVDRLVCSPEDGSRALRVRPAVVIAEI